jgi:hypothetical protein
MVQISLNNIQLRIFWQCGFLKVCSCFSECRGFNLGRYSEQNELHLVKIGSLVYDLMSKFPLCIFGDYASETKNFIIRCVMVEKRIFDVHISALLRILIASLLTNHLDTPLALLAGCSPFGN